MGGSALSRGQIAVYAAIGVVLLLLGIRAVRGDDGATGGSESGGGGGIELAAGPGSGSGAGAGDLVVHVAGAVEKPGVYRLPTGSRVADAVERAGGPRGDGLVDAINLAAQLGDGQQVVVPERVPGGGTAAVATGESTGPISLGSATEADLEEIDGIGPVTAADIIEYRDQNGGVASIEELDEVPGIGPATVEALAEDLQP